jgi:hypothetical protein
MIIAGISLTSLLAGAQGAEVDGDISLMQGSGPFSSIQEIKNYDAANQGTRLRSSRSD